MQSSFRFPIPLAPIGVVISCLIITTIDGFNLVIFGQALPLLLEDQGMHISEAAAGVLGAMVYLGSFPINFVATVLAEKVGRHRILSICVLTFVIGGLLSAVAPNAFVLAVARFISGLGVGGAVPTALTLARNNATPNRASLVMVTTMAGVPIGGMIAGIMSTNLVNAGLSWRSFFIANTLLSAVVLILSLVVRAEEPTHVLDSEKSSTHRILELFGPKFILITAVVCTVSALNMSVWLGLNNWLATTMHARGFELPSAMSFMTVMSLSAIIGSFILAWLSDVFGPALITPIAACITLLGLIGLSQSSTMFIASALCVTLVGVGGHSAQTLLNAAAADKVAPQSRGSIIAVSTAASSIGAFAGPVIGGASFGSGGGALLMTVFCTILGVTAVLTWILYPMLKTKHQEEAPVSETVIA